MVIEIKEYSEKTRHIKNNDKSKKYIYVDKKIQDIMKKYYQIKRTLIIQHNFTNFIEDYNRYRAESFNVH